MKRTLKAALGMIAWLACLIGLTRTSFVPNGPPHRQVDYLFDFVLWCMLLAAFFLGAKLLREALWPLPK